jgi:hypothetical protein
MFNSYPPFSIIFKLNVSKTRVNKNTSMKFAKYRFTVPLNGLTYSLFYTKHQFPSVSYHILHAN